MRGSSLLTENDGQETRREVEKRRSSTEKHSVLKQAICIISSSMEGHGMARSNAPTVEESRGWGGNNIITYGCSYLLQDREIGNKKATLRTTVCAISSR